MTKKIFIEGMSCEHCVKHVKDALAELNGVIKVDVNLSAKSAILESAAVISDDDIKAAIDDAGYEVVKIEAI